MQNSKHTDSRATKIIAKDYHHLSDLIYKAMQADGVHCDLNHIDVRRVTDMSSLFYESTFNGSIDRWDVSRVQSMAFMFSISSFQGSLENWIVSRVEEMPSMFENSIFVGPLDRWNVSATKSVNDMFVDSAFQQNLSSWLMPNVCTFKQMFDHQIFSDKPPFRGSLPQVGPLSNRAFIYAMLLGGPEELHDYLKNTAFNDAHIDVLLSDAGVVPFWLNANHDRHYSAVRSAQEVAYALNMDKDTLRKYITQNNITQIGSTILQDFSILEGI